jgi:hypothetical protein
MFSAGIDTMDMQTPDHRPRPSLSRSFKTHLLKALAGTVPAHAGDDPAARDETIETMRELLDALDPGDAADAQLAAIAIAASLSAIDGFTRAARVGVSDETATRLRSNALAAGRTYATTRQTLRRRRPELAAVSKPPQAAAAPRPADVSDRRHDEFEPRDRFDKPVSALHTDLTMRAKLLATVALPRDPALDAAAVAEAEAMIAEPAAQQNAAAVGVGAGAG